MNPRYVRVVAQLRALITEGERVAALERDYEGVRYIAQKVPLRAWLVSADNILRTVFGKESAHFQHLLKATDRPVEYSYEVEAIQGILTGALADLEGGFLSGQEQLVAGVVFDSVLEQARLLAKSGHKDPAAVLVRVVVEDGLRRLARSQGIDDSGNAARLNDALKDAARFGKPMWRQVQAWLDIGNAAAHGKFNEYNEETVLQAIEDVSRFWAQEVER